MSVPAVVPVAGESMAPELMVTALVSVPIPPSVAALATVVAEAVSELFTISAPASTATAPVPRLLVAARIKLPRPVLVRLLFAAVTPPMRVNAPAPFEVLIVPWLVPRVTT